jgi:hypothetical protein
MFCIDTDGSIGKARLSAGSHWIDDDFSFVRTVGSSVYVAYNKGGVVQKYEDGVVTTIADFGEHVDFGQFSGFEVADDGTCFVSGKRKPNILLLCSPQGQVSELDCHEELVLMDARRNPVLVGCSESGDLVELDFSTAPPKRTVLLLDEEYARAAFAPDGSLHFALGSCLYSLENGEPQLIHDMDNSLLSGNVSISLIKFAADGTLFVATVDTHTDSFFRTSFWTIRGLSSPLPKQHPLVTSMGVDSDLSISINGFDLKLHKSFAAVRCPSFSVNKIVHSQPVDHVALDTFRRFLYSDQLPDTLTPSQLMGLAVCEFFYLRRLRCLLTQICHRSFSVTVQIFSSFAWTVSKSLKPFNRTQILRRQLLS